MKKITLSLCLLFSAFFSIGQDESNTDSTTNVALETDDMFSMSLEDLLNVEIESATKSSMSIQKAPSVVRVFTDKDFANFGFTTVKDVLNSVPGIQLQEYRAGHQLVWVRGVQTRYNNKVLLLIDGVPMRDSYYGNFNVDEMIPLENIKKIEVLNGPGSVLYGANSFAGVISITTKSEGKSVQAAYGSFNSLETFAEYDVNGFYASGKFYQTDGFQPEYQSDGYQRDVDQKGQLGYGSLKYKYNDLTLAATMTNYVYPYKYRSTKKEYVFTRTPITGSITYKPQIDETSSLSVLAYVNDYGFSREKTKFINRTSDTIKEHSVNRHDTQIWGSEISYNKIAGKHSFIIGNSWQMDRAIDMKETIDYHIDGAGELGVGESILDPEVARTVIGFYGQDVYEINEYLLLTGGLRYDVLTAFDDQFNYRIGLTGQKGKVYGKALYGTAYRVPSYREYLDVDAPNLALGPEHLKTLELQVGYVTKKFDVNLTFFNNSYEDFIQELVVDSIFENGVYREVDDEMAFNFKKKNISGLEINANIIPKSGLLINTGLTVLLNTTEELGSLSDDVYVSQAYTLEKNELAFLGSMSGFLNASYTINKKYTFGLNTLFMGDRGVTKDYQEGVPSGVQNVNNAKGYVKMDLISRIRLLSRSNLHLTLKVANLLNSKIYSPPFGGSTDYDIEWTGMTYRVGAIYKF